LRSTGARTSRQELVEGRGELTLRGQLATPGVRPLGSHGATRRRPIWGRAEALPGSRRLPTDHAGAGPALLYKLAGQAVAHLHTYLKDEEEVLNVLQFHQKTLACLVHAQME